MARADCNTQEKRGDAVISQALAILSMRLQKPGALLGGASQVSHFLRLKLATKPHEIFCVIFLDTQNRFIAFEELFRGTLTETAVFPRQIAMRAFAHNAAGVIFVHNHPSGSAEPSVADKLLTQFLKRALVLVEVRVLDHFVVGGDNVFSFADHGLMDEATERPQLRKVNAKVNR